jgi:hypothetical protein
MRNQQKIKGLFLIIILFGISCLMGCAVGVTRIKVGHDPLIRIEEKKEGSILLNEFRDARNKPGDYIGNKRNMYGMVMGHIGMGEGISLPDLLTKYFAETLREAGYTVVIAKGSVPVGEGGRIKFDAAIDGEILEFWMDLYMAVWHKVAVKLTIKNGDGKEILWEKIVDGEEKNVLWLGATSEYEKVIRQALTKALNKAVSEFGSPEFHKAVKLDKARIEKEIQKPEAVQRTEEIQKKTEIEGQKDREPAKEVQKEIPKEVQKEPQKETRKEAVFPVPQKPQKEKTASISPFNSIPLPKYEISLPPSGAPPEIKKLTGRWQGVWTTGRIMILIVEKVNIENNRVQCLHAYGGSVDGMAGYDRVSARLIPGRKPEIKFTGTRGGRRFAFTLEGDQLRGTMQADRRSDTIVLEKVEGD